jgi:hypothetical protein
LWRADRIERKTLSALRPARGQVARIFYYTFLVALSLLVAALIGNIFYVGFQMVNRML